MGNLRFKIMMKEEHSIEIHQLKDEKMIDGNNIHIYEEDDKITERIILKLEVDGYFTIYYHYNVYPTGLQDFTVYINGNIIFLGGKAQSCTVDMFTNTIGNEFKHCLFWDFSDLENGLILEYGELDCLLRNDLGEIIETTYVEPPYDVFYEEDQIRFEFESVIAGGHTYLKLPTNKE